jgi:hypothetical protein
MNEKLMRNTSSCRVKSGAQQLGVSSSKAMEVKGQRRKDPGQNVQGRVN